MIVVRIGAGVTGVANGNEVAVIDKALRGAGFNQCVAQVKITGTLTTKLQGRLTASHDWVDLATFSATGVNSTVPMMPFMRFSNTSGTGTLDYMDVGFIPR